jgi:thioredoxin-like negative regulator of GroEL
MKDRASSIRANASRRLQTAERALAAARTSMEAQAQLVAQLRKRKQDTTAAEVLLGNLHEVVARRKVEVEGEATNLERLRRTPDWQLNKGSDQSD